jgi:crossover junction endodeoxyribonuclease RusA
MQIITASETVVVSTVEFWVPGIPKPQGSKRGFVHPRTKRVILTESAGAPLKDWRHDLKLIAADAMAGRLLMTQPHGVHLTIGFVLPRPVSLPKSKPTPLAVKKPDTDKLTRAVCDALTGAVYADDSMVIGMTLHKRTAELGEPTGAAILVEEVALP